VGGAWQVGALVAIRDAVGWEPHTADAIIGTSSGAHLAAMLGSGVTVDELLAAQRGDSTAHPAVRHFFTEPPAASPTLPLGGPSLRLARRGLADRNRLTMLSGLLPRGRSNPDFLVALVEGVVGDREWFPHPATWLVGVDVATGERVAFGAPGAPQVSARDALLASWSVPGWYPPVRIGERTYVDGGVSSTASADLLAPLDLDEVIIVAPMASAGMERVPGVLGRVEHFMRTSMSRSVERDVDTLTGAGIRVVRVHPGDAELAQMGFNFMDPRHRLDALNAALEHVPARLARSLAEVRG
jgi:NTE family protein